MTFDEYQEAALRTASMRIGADTEMCIRALGLCGETEEFRYAVTQGSAEAEIKEAGDVLWYTAALAAAFDLKAADLHLDGGPLDNIPCASWNATECVRYLQTAVCQLAELVKKHVGHKKPADPERVGFLLGQVVRQLAGASLVSLDRVAVENVAKLKARYPDGFSTAIASVKPDSAP